MPPHRGSELIAVPQLAGSLQLSGQGRVLCALMAEGTVRCATQKTQETPFAKARELVAKLEFVPLKGVADAVRIGATYDFVCALRKNGQVSCADTDKLDKDASVVLWEQP
jgi:predicted alternative tryptophan synthase beta-subunit